MYLGLSHQYTDLANSVTAVQSIILKTTHVAECVYCCFPVQVFKLPFIYPLFYQLVFAFYPPRKLAWVPFSSSPFLIHVFELYLSFLLPLDFWSQMLRSSFVFVLFFFFKTISIPIVELELKTPEIESHVPPTEPARCPYCPSYQLKSIFRP